MESDWGRGRGCFRRVAREGPLEKVTFELNPEWWKPGSGCSKRVPGGRTPAGTIQESLGKQASMCCVCRLSEAAVLGNEDTGLTEGDGGAGKKWDWVQVGRVGSEHPGVLSARGPRQLPHVFPVLFTLTLWRHGSVLFTLSRYESAGNSMRKLRGVWCGSKWGFECGSAITSRTDFCRLWRGGFTIPTHLDPLTMFSSWEPKWDNLCYCCKV